MKTSLFLVLAGTTFALCNCQQQTTPTTTEAPVAPAPIKVVADKNEITPVTNGGGLAPASVKGKTITFNYANAKTAEKVGGDPWGNWTSSSKSSENFSFPNGNVYKTNTKDSFALQSRTYTKTGKTTAKIIEQYGEMSSSYILTFTTPTSGTAVHNENAGMAEVKTKDITFTIN